MSIPILIDPRAKKIEGDLKRVFMLATYEFQPNMHPAAKKMIHVGG